MSTPTFLSLVRRTATALLLALLASCGGGSGSDPTPAAPVATEGSATVDASGGTVAGPDGVSLSIPAESLDTSTTVRIARDSTGAPELLGMTLASPIYAVTPHGTGFTTNALLKLPFDASKIPTGSKAVVLRGEPDGTWHVQPLTSTQPGVAAVDVSSLSWYAVGVCTPGDAGVFGFGIGDCPTSHALTLEYLDSNGLPTPVPRDAFFGYALPFPNEITTPTDVVLRLTWSRPAGVNRTDGLFLSGPSDLYPSGDVINEHVNQDSFSKTVTVHLDPAQTPGAFAAHGIIKHFYATASYCWTGFIVGRGANQTVCWSFDTDLAFRLHDLHPPSVAAPTILVQPVDAGVRAGEQAIFTVTASVPSDDGLSFTWQRRDTSTQQWKDATDPHAFATVGTAASSVVPTQPPVFEKTGTFTITPVSRVEDYGAKFRAHVCAGSVFSSVISCTDSLEVTMDLWFNAVAPAWTLQPVDASIPVGTTASFTVTATGRPAPIVTLHIVPPAGAETTKPCPYQSSSSGTTTCTLTTGPLGVGDSGTTVWAEAWNDQAKASTITSSTATLTVSGTAVAPSISSQPVATTATLGGTASFSVGAGGTAPLSYQWRFNGTPLADHAAGSGTSGVSGSGAATLSLSNVQTGDVGNYSVVVSNGTAPNATSNAVVLTITQRSAVGMRLALGFEHSCAVKPDNTVACWGQNDFYNQLGDGSGTSKSTPIAVSGIGDIVQLAAGGGHTCGLHSDGSMSCWGANGEGQLGHGATTQVSYPYTTPEDLPLIGLTAIVGGAFHTCAVQQDGSVLCWGFNEHGQLGDGTSTRHSLPTPIPGLSGVVSLAAGSGHTCAARSDGSVLCWGNNFDGQLGDGTTVDKSVPTLVPNLSGVVALSAGWSNTCALKSDHTVVCWGSNANWELGNNSMLTSQVPIAVPGLSDVVSLGMGNSDHHTCAVKSNGSLWCWGANGFGQLGDGSQVDRLPTAVPGLIGVASVAMGNGHTCAFKTDGTLFCWGMNNYGQLGDRSTVQRLTPTLVAF